jgi:hypothetical protein
MSSKDQYRRQMLTFLKEHGFDVEVSGSGHFAARHPALPRPLFVARSPTDHRAIKNNISWVKRALRAAEAAGLSSK